MSEFGGRAENICSHGVFRILTQPGHPRAAAATRKRTLLPWLTFVILSGPVMFAFATSVPVPLNYLDAAEGVRHCRVRSSPGLPSAGACFWWLLWWSAPCSSRYT